MKEVNVEYVKLDENHEIKKLEEEARITEEQEKEFERLADEQLRLTEKQEKIAESIKDSINWDGSQNDAIVSYIDYNDPEIRKAEMAFRLGARYLEQGMIEKGTEYLKTAEI